MKQFFTMMATVALCLGLAACNGGQKGQKDCCQEGQQAECCQQEKGKCCGQSSDKPACCQAEQKDACCQSGQKAACCQEAGKPACCQAPTFDEVVASRRSVRSYDGTRKISEAEVREVIAAAQEAPSWINYEPTKYYVAMSAEKIAAVKKAVGRNADRLEGVSALIVSSFENEKSGFVDGRIADPIGNVWGGHDCGLSNAFLVLKARAMGFDTLIMGGRDADALRKTFSIPENETVMAVIALGYRKDDPKRPDRRPLDEIVKFF
ncbi:MAG: nitroreductase family protein [Bacteroidales bacterium]|nr:nitroreductase family protein [Bacteroidales bacterium]